MRRDRLVVHLDEQAPNAAADVGGRRGDGMDAASASGGEQRPVQPERRADVIVEQQGEPLDSNPGPAPAAAARAAATAQPGRKRPGRRAGPSEPLQLADGRRERRQACPPDRPGAPGRCRDAARPAALTLSLEIAVPRGDRTTQAAQAPALLLRASWLTASPLPPTSHEASGQVVARVALEGRVGVPRAELRVAKRGAVGAGAGGRGCRECRAGDDRDGQQRAGSGRGGAWASVLRSFPVLIAQCSKPNSGRPAGGGALPGWGARGTCGAGGGAGGGAAA